MSYQVKVGEAAYEAATTEKKDFSKMLRKFKDGSVYKVRIPNAHTYAQYFSHGVYGSFYTTIHTDDDLYCKASQHYYSEAKKAADAGNEKESEALRQKGYELKKKERYLFGFFDLETEGGQEMLVDVTKKQAVGLMKTIKKYDGKYGKFAFELSKSGNGQGTLVSLDPIVDMDDLKSSEAKNFEASGVKEFDLSVFGKVFQDRSHEEQAQDLDKYGFDTAILGLNAKDEDPNSENSEEPAGEQGHNF